MDTADDDLALPIDLRHEELDREGAEHLLMLLEHPSPGPWLDQKLASEVIETRDDPPRIASADLWRELLRDECDKLYNQAWCALEAIREAENEDEALFLGMDDLPSAVEQAYSLAPPFAAEHLALLAEHKPERLADLRRELGVGEEREPRERVACLEFWEENAPDLSDLRKTLFGLVRGELTRRLAKT